MSAIRHAANCRWATPTLFLRPPFWLDADANPWTCLRDGSPRPLSTTDRCSDCPRWEPRTATTVSALDHDEPPVIPLMTDWFGAFPPPHEVVE